MSFFIKKQQQTLGKRPHVKKTTKTKHTAGGDELTSSSEEENEKSGENYESDDPDETPQAKKLRLAKTYLQEVQREVLEQQKHDEEQDDGQAGDINKRLRDDCLQQAGKLRTAVADKYTGVDTENMKIVQCKEFANCITCSSIVTGNEYVFFGTKNAIIIRCCIKDLKKQGGTPLHTKSIAADKCREYINAISSIAVSTDNKFLAVGGATRNILIFNPETLKYVYTLRGHSDTITGLVFRKDSHTLYSCSKDRTVKVWSLNEMTYVETLYGHQNEITSIDALSRAQAITSGGQDNTVRLWKVMEESHFIYNSPEGNIDVVRFLNEEIFISGSDNGHLCVWTLKGKKPRCAVKEAHGVDPKNLHPHWICSIATLINTDLIASGSHDGFVRVWKLSDKFRKIDLLFEIPVKGFVNSLNFTSDGKLLIAGIGQEHRLGRWNVLKDVKASVVAIPLKQS